MLFRSRPAGRPCCRRTGGQPRSQPQHLPSGASCLRPRLLYQPRRAQHRGAARQLYWGTRAPQHHHRALSGGAAGGARAGSSSGPLHPGQGPLVWGASAPPEEEGPQQPPGFTPAPQKAAPAAALGWHRTTIRTRLRQAGRPTSTSQPAACWQNKHQLKQRRKCLHVVDKAVGVAVPTHAAFSLFRSWRWAQKRSFISTSINQHS